MRCCKLHAAETPQETSHRRVRAAIQNLTEDLLRFADKHLGREYDEALRGEVAPELEVRFVSITALIAMKEAAGRPPDLGDIQHLRWIMEDGKLHERDPGQY